MSQIVADAGHNKFPKQLLLNKEMEILDALEFRFDHRSAYEEATYRVKAAIFQNEKLKLTQDDMDKLLSFISFLCHLAVHNMFLSANIESKNVAIASIILSLRYLRRSHESFDMALVWDEDEDINMGDDSPALHQIKKMIKYFKGILVVDYNEVQYKKAKNVLLQEYQEYLSEKTGLKNLFKQFPEFLSQESYQLTATSTQMSI